MTPEQELQGLYRDAFGKENYNYVKHNIDLSVGSWIGDLNAIIDPECRSKLAVTLNNEEKGVVVVQYLTTQNDIDKYKKFIQLWKKHDPAKATQFEAALQLSIREKQLTHIDDQFPVGGINNATLPSHTTISAEGQFQGNKAPPSINIPGTAREPREYYPDPDPIKWADVWLSRINENLNFLLSSLDFHGNTVLDTLSAKSVITQDQVDFIRAEKTQNDRNRKFIEIIKKVFPQDVKVVIDTVKPHSRVLAAGLQKILDEAYMQCIT